VEAADDYGKRSSDRLEVEGFEQVLTGAEQVKNLPGRPEDDPGDFAWLMACSLAPHGPGLLRGQLAVPGIPAARPPPQGPDCRPDPGRQRAEKPLESAAIKVSSVSSLARTGDRPDTVDHLIAAVRNPRALAEMACGRVPSPRFGAGRDG
jgi:hypothetical protein